MNFGLSHLCGAKIGVCFIKELDYGAYLKNLIYSYNNGMVRSFFNKYWSPRQWTISLLFSQFWDAKVSIKGIFWLGFKFIMGLLA